MCKVLILSVGYVCTHNGVYLGFENNGLVVFNDERSWCFRITQIAFIVTKH